jgi:hypothetical protein
MTTQTRFCCELDPADAKRLQSLAADSMFDASDHLKLAALEYLRHRERWGTVARLSATPKPTIDSITTEAARLSLRELQELRGRLADLCRTT